MELRGRIEAELGGIARLEPGFHAAQEKTGEAGPTSSLPPQRGRANRVREGVGPIDEEQWLAFNTKISVVAKGMDQPIDMPLIVFLTVTLVDEHLLAPPIPCPSPRLVRPT